MQAKTVYEFERGIDPKEVLGIGGFILDEKYKEIMEPALNKWETFINSLVGKKITCNMAEYEEEEFTWKKRTVLVHDIEQNNDGDIIITTKMDTWNHQYILDTESKIFIQ
jgi:hypothetical protein